MAARRGEDDIERRVTAPGTGKIVGNELFRRATAALGLAPEIGGQVLADVLLPHGIKPFNCAPADLTRALPEIRRRLRAFVNDALIDETMARLGRAIDLPGDSRQA